MNNKTQSDERKDILRSENNLLMLMRDEQVSFDLILVEYNIPELVNKYSNRFLRDILLASLTTKTHVTNKFVPLVTNMIKWLINGELGRINIGLVHQEIIEHLVEKEEVEILRGYFLAFDEASSAGSRVRDIHNCEVVNLCSLDGYVEDNSPALLMACARNNYQIAQILVSKGYR